MHYVEISKDLGLPSGFSTHSNSTNFFHANVPKCYQTIEEVLTTWVNEERQQGKKRVRYGLIYQ